MPEIISSSIIVKHNDREFEIEFYPLEGMVEMYDLDNPEDYFETCWNFEAPGHVTIPTKEDIEEVIKLYEQQL